MAHTELREDPPSLAPQGVAARILQACQQESCSLSTLATLVTEDPVLGARLRRFCTAAKGLSSGDPIGDCIGLLGVTAVKNLALVFSLWDQHRNGPCRGFDYRRYWSEVLLTYFIMMEMQEEETPRVAHETGTWAMLSSLGCLALATTHPLEYTEILGCGGELAALEDARLNTNHLRLSVELLTPWGLPSSLAGRVLAQQEPGRMVEDGAPATSFAVDVWHFSCRTARQLCQAKEQAGSLASVLFAFANAYGKSHAQLITKIQQAVAKSLAAAEALGLELSVTSVMPLGKLPDGTANSVADSWLRILIVEDDPIVRTLLETWLKVQVGHSVISADNGEQALELARQHLPQLIITDWSMPVMDGIAFCKALRQADWGKSIYVLMLTASSGDDDLVEAFEAGVDDFLLKPVKRQALGARLQAAWRYIHFREQWRQDNQRLVHANEQLELKNRQLLLHSTADTLTGLPNRRAGQRALTQAMSAAQRHGLQMCVFCFDLDCMQLLQDSAGHVTGDEILQLIGVTVQQTLRNEDTVCRWGEDAFLIIAPGTAMADGIKAAQRLREAVVGHLIALESSSISVTIHIGVACWDAESKSREQLLLEVEQALGAAKQAGKNRIAVLVDERTQLI